MGIKAKNNGCPEGCICEQFGYLVSLDEYLNSSDIYELCDMSKGGVKNE